MDSATLPVSFDDLYTLTTDLLPSYRQLRYNGDGIAMAFDDFSSADQQVVGQMYQHLLDLLALLNEHHRHPDETFSRLIAYGDSVNWDALLQQVRGITSPDPHHAKVLHDLRGGGLMALMVYFQMIHLDLVKPSDLHRIFNLTRDQLKIMRNSVRGIDPTGFEHDLSRNLHHIDLLLEKWGSGEGHQIQGARAEVLVDCRFRGWVSERCLEFSALDRVIYNLINNATAHTADGRVYLSIFPLGAEPANLRFVVINRVTAAQEVRILDRFPAGPGQLFVGGFTTGGSGLGMRICADFVGNAYGIPSVAQALEKGYLGARFIDGHFVAWFHWPIVSE
ncbi:MAG: HAMP domain-containing histidine kinase [Oscillochloris sp.]|nr:HAMP domain-containing histidine kinase [Oscillochloris sp.]